MNVAIAVVTVRLPGARSLKDKRAVVQSLLARLRDRYNLSVAEVESQDTTRWAALGIATVNSDPAHAQSTLDSALRYMESELIGKGEITDVHQETLTGFTDEE